MTTGRRWLRSLVCALVVAPWLGGSTPARAADQAAINAAIDKGVGFLRSKLGELADDAGLSTVALAMLKSKVPPDSPELRSVVEKIRTKIEGGVYKPAHHHVYEASSDATFLADLGGEDYEAELKAIRDYIISVRFPTGGWDYPAGSGHARGTQGDTSVTQYACLGLWAATRAGVEVPDDLWNGVLGWALANQNPDGGFAYVPGQPQQGIFQAGSDPNMTFAGMSVLLIAVRHLYPELADTIYGREAVNAAENRPQPNAPDEGPLGGVLQRIDLTKVDEPAAPRPTPASPRIGLDRVRGGINRGRAWIEARYRPTNETRTLFPHYYFYTVERVGALANQRRFGTLDWYDASSAAILQSQNPDGSFGAKTMYSSEAVNTAFVLLFLSKSTTKTIGRTPEPPVGGGLLTGGQGEPTEVVAAKKDPTPLDQLLASLQNPGSVDLLAAQSDLIEQIQLGDREDLIGQKEMLVKLIQHPHGEVRRTAAWALGRTNDLRLARYLIDALEDPDLGVMIEAHASLAWLSRRFDGFGLPANPLDPLDANASEQERQTAIRGWRVRARREWGNWYLRVRPYSDRGDEFEAQLRQRLADR